MLRSSPRACSLNLRSLPGDPWSLTNRPIVTVRASGVVRAMKSRQIVSATSALKPAFGPYSKRNPLVVSDDGVKSPKSRKGESRKSSTVNRA